MATIQDLLPVATNQSDLSTGIVPTSSTPSIDLSVPGDNTIPSTDQQWWDQFAAKPASLSTQMDPIQFDWESTGAERFAQDSHIKQLGFDPYLGSKTVNGKSYDLNELKYQQAQTFGDVMKAGIGQFTGLAWNSFKNSAVSDGHFLNALFDFSGTPYFADFKERMIGSPEELLQMDKEQKDIMNKHAIFESPDTQGIFNKEFFGSMLGQLGFTVGTGAYVALQTLLTAGIMDAIAPVARAGQLAKLGKAITTAGGDAAKTGQLLEYAKNVQRGINTGEAVNDIRKMTDLAKDRNFMQSVYDGMKNLLPGYQAVNDYQMAKVAGATVGEGVAAGLPGLIKSYTMFNAARAEATMEASNTYGQLYTSLMNSYEKKNGQPATGEELQRITNAAYGAATDNFITNTGLLSAMNEIEFGNMVSKFSSTRRLFREAAENTGKDMYAVTAKNAEGALVSKAYESGRFGALGNFSAMRKDFGMGTALWQVAKKAVGGQAAKFEGLEGLQEILQNVSDESFRDYYTNLYNGNKDLNGNYLKDITSADWGKGLASQLNQEGWKTFLMGATTGLFLSPISSMSMYAREKGQAAISQEYRDQWDAQKKITSDNVDLINAFYNDAKGGLLEHLGGMKTQMASAKNMQDALVEASHYTFYNGQADALSKAAATSIKTGTIENFLATLKSLGDGRITDEEFATMIGYTGKEPLSAKTFIDGIAKNVEQYYTNYQNLKDQFGDLIIPEIHTDPVMYRLATEQKAAFNDATELLATTSYHVSDTIRRMGEIRSEMAKLPGIGSSVHTSFDTLGNEQQTKTEIATLQDQIKTYEDIGTSKDSTGKEIAQELKLLKQQLEHLQSWDTNWNGYKSAQETTEKEKHLQPLYDAFSNYISISNQLSGVGDPILRTDKEKAFKGLSDYMVLNRDHGQYVDALNTLSEPRNFKKVYEKILKAQQDGVTAAHESTVNEAKARAAATTGNSVTTPTETPEEATDTETPTSTLDARSDILRYYSEDEAIQKPDGQGGVSYQPQDALSAEARKLLDKYPGLEAKLDSIRQTTTNPKDIPARVEEAIKKAEKELEDKKNKEQEDKDKENKLRNEWAKELDNIPVKFPKKAGISPEGIAEVNKLRAEETAKITAKYKKLLGEDAEPTVDENKLGKLKNIHALVSIAPAIVDNTTKELVPLATVRKMSKVAYNTALKETKQRITDILKGVTRAELLQNLSLSVKVNAASQETTPITDNINVKAQNYWLEMKYKGETLGFLTNADPFIINIDNETLDVFSIDSDNIEEIYTPKSWETTVSAAGEFRNDAFTSMSVQIAIENAIAKGQTEFSGTDLFSILNVRAAVQLDYLATGEQGPLFSDLQTTMGVNIDGVQQLVVVDNKVNEDGTRNHNLVLGSINALSYLPPIPVHENTGMYSVAITVGGEFRWIQLTPTVYDAEQMKVTLDRITELSSKENKTKADIDEIRSLLRGIFIALPVYYREENGERVVDKSQKWDVRLGYNDKKNTVIITIDQVGVKPLTTNTSKFSTAEDLAKAVQKMVSKYLPEVTITQDNFRHQIPVTGMSTREEIVKAVMNMTASVHPNVAKSVSLHYGLPENQSTLIQQNQPSVQEKGPQVVAPVPGARRMKNVGMPEQQRQHDEKEASTTDRLQAAEANDVAAMRAARKSRGVKKVVQTATFNEQDVENIGKFIQEMDRMVPKDILSVENLGILQHNLEDTHTTVGQFYISLDGLRGTIQVHENTPGKYHEAFHGIFRMLLSEERIQQLLDNARKEYNITDNVIKNFLEERPEYIGRDNKVIEERILEEYMADKFDAWKMNKKTPASNTLKGFFSWLVDLVKEFFANITGNKLQSLFYSVNKGQYKNARLQVNHFNNVQEGISEPVNKVVKIGTKKITTGTGKVMDVDHYLSQPVADQLSSTIAALYHKTVKDIGQHDKNKVLNSILDKYKETYNAELPIYKRRADAITDIAKRADWWDKLFDLEEVFKTKKDGSDSIGRRSLKEAVDLHLNIMGYRQSLDEESMDDLEQEEGQRNVDTKYKKTSPLAHYSSLSKFLRGYIGSTTYELGKDEFGNKQLVDGTPIYATCNANKIYNGMLKTLSNTTDENELLGRLLEYTKHGGNPETTTFINQVLSEVGFDYDTNTPTKNSILLQQVIKGFQQWSTKYLFTQVNGNNEYRTSYANTRDAAKNQRDEWYANNKALNKTDTKGLSLLSNALNTSQAETEETTTSIGKLADRISRNIFKETGISLHPMYIHYSLVANKKPEYRKIDQQKMIDLYPDAYEGRLTKSLLDANLITPMTKGEDIFSRTAEEVEYQEGDKTKKGTPQQFLMKIAGTNSTFDESVNTMSFANANGETVYSHQFQNYSFIATQELNNNLNNLDEEHHSFLVDDENFQALANRKSIAVEQIDGLKKVFESTNDTTGESFVNKFLEVNREPGATYGDYNKREFLATLLGFYDVTKMPDAAVRNGSDKFYKVPVLIRVIESKNSGHVVRVPVMKAVDSNGRLSKLAQERMYSIIKQEFDRIRVAQAEIEAGGNIIGYHTETYNKKTKETIPPRGLTFFNSKLMLGPLAESLEVIAQNTKKDLDTYKKDIIEQITNYWQEQTKELAKEMFNEGLIKGYKEGTTGKIEATNALAPSYLFNGFADSEVGTAMNINKDFGHNLAQVLVNDYLNTTALNTMIFGNEAKSFTDSIDQVKRMAGANADGPNMNISFIAPDMGIDHTLENFYHVTYKSDKVLSGNGSGNTIDSDDGQMYMTEKGLRYMLFGLGKLTRLQADILDKLANGGLVSEKEFFGAGGMRESGGAFNSTKLVYFDGNTYLKCSAISLFKTYIDRIWSKELDDLRKKLEDYEERNSTVVFAHPVSVSKALKQNIAPSSDEIDDSHFNQLQSRFMREQLQNPSNKLVITDPTQAKQQIMAEQNPNTKVMFLGNETTVGAVREAYMNDVSQRITNNYGTKANAIFTLDKGLIHLQQAIAGNITPQLGVFFDTMRETLQATGADQQTLGFLETRDGKPVYNLNFPSTLEKFTQIFLNYFSKGVTAEKIPGMTVALASGAKGMGRRVKQVISVDPVTGQPRSWKVITDKEYTSNPSKYQSAREWDNKDQRTYVDLQVGDYYIDDLRHNVAEYDAQGNIIGRFSECIIPAHYKEQMRGPVEALQYAFGVRIPTDDKHSMLSLKWVDTMPVQYGSTAVFPHELIEISGADFDIDKMFISIADTYNGKEDAVILEKFNKLKDQISGYRDELTQLSARFESTVAYSPEIAARSKEIKSRIKDIEEQYQRGIITQDEYDEQSGILEYEQSGLGTEEGKKERGPIVRRMKALSRAIKQLKKERDIVLEELQNSSTRVPYGTETGTQGQFDEFLKWNLDNNKVLKDKIKELKSLYIKKEDSYGIIDSDVIADDEDINEMFNLSSDMLLYKTALKEMGMPSDPIEYALATKDGANLNNGVLNNRVLAQKIAMLNNEDISGGDSAIINTPTSTDPLADLADELIKEFEAIDPNHSILKILREGFTDVNSLLGKIAAYSNNKEGARNIGATANAIQVYALLQQYGVQIEEGYRLNIDGHEYSSFEHTKEYIPGNIKETVLYKNGKVKEYTLTTGEKVKPGDPKIQEGGYTGERIPAVLGTLLNAMTDNAKERLAARLGLNITALGYVSYMVAQGVPMKTGVLLMLQPSVRKYFAQLQKLEGSLKTQEEIDTVKSFLLQKTIDTYGSVVGGPVTTQGMVDNITTNGKDQSLELSMLQTLQTIDNQSKVLANISGIQKLSQGIPTTWEDIDRMQKRLSDVGIAYVDNQYVPKSENVDSEGNSLSVDVRNILTKDQKIIATNIKVMGQVQQLSKLVFMEKTPLFSRLSNIAWDNLSVRKGQKEEFGKTLKHDIISYLSIRAYKHWLSKNDPQQSLDNAMIYPSVRAQKSPSYQDIIQTIDGLRKKLTGENSNALLSFLMTQTKDGIMTAEANTWARLSDLQQDRLVSSYVDLYTDNYLDADGNTIPTHDAAVALFNYLLVKDGGQFKSGSFIRYIPNFVFTHIMNRTTEVNDLLSQPGWNESKAYDLFGVPAEQVLNDFMVSYGTHIGNRFYVKEIKHTPSATPKALARVGDTYHISIYRNIREQLQDTHGDGLYYSPLYKTDKFNEQETKQYKENIKTLEDAGFTIKSIKKGKETQTKVVMPYSIKINNQLYVLKNAGTDEEASPSRVISKDQTTALGITGQYIKKDWTGNKATFKASGVFGLVSNTGITEQSTKQSGQSNVSLQQMTSEQWESELITAYAAKQRNISQRDWIAQQITFRDRSQSIGATDTDILNTIKCL